MPESPREENQTAHLLGWYSNYCVVGHNPHEFIVDFGQHDSDDQAIKFHTRTVVTGPFYAKAPLDLLKTSVEEYEQRFGSILP
jgi:hypothetical protein